AKKGAGVFNMFLSQPLIAGCTITGNAADEEGGGLYTYFNSTVGVVNTIVSANAPEQVGGSPMTVSYSCIVGGYPGTAVLAVDPMFTRQPSPGPDAVWGTPDDDYGDLTPRPGSRCIDAGNSSAVPSTAIEDLSHNPRRRDDAGTPDTGIGGAPAV